jgi:hypothetical protein
METHPPDFGNHDFTTDTIVISDGGPAPRPSEHSKPDGSKLELDPARAEEMAHAARYGMDEALRYEAFAAQPGAAVHIQLKRGRSYNRAGAAILAESERRMADDMAERAGQNYDLRMRNL